ncbi:MAG: chemotaxis protein CheW [Halothece sp. Uz-M2-17]|nr:chemotaxis protein CheW [Halothece sp. Uz-M2-17]
MAPSPSEEKERFLSFPINNNLQGLVPLEALQGVVQVNLSQILPIPETPPALLGILSWRGEAIWTVDLPQLLGETTSLPQNKTQCFSAITTDQGKNLGLLVEQFTAVSAYNQKQDLQPMPSGMVSSEIVPYLQGYFLSEDQKTPSFLLNLDVIFEILN